MIDSMKTTIRTASLGLIAAGPLLSGGAQADAADPQAWIDEQVGGNETLSISAARVSKGDAAYFGAGPADADAQTPADVATRYQIGSLTKAFTHLLLAEMAAVGAVGYDTTVAGLIGERVEFANPDVGRITLLELATHISQRYAAGNTQSVCSPLRVRSKKALSACQPAVRASTELVRVGFWGGPLRPWPAVAKVSASVSRPASARVAAMRAAISPESHT